MRETLTVQFDEAAAAALRRESKQSGRSRGEIVREAVAAHLSRHSGPTVMSTHFGTLEGPSDLSTNKAYRRAWSKKRR